MLPPGRLGALQQAVLKHLASVDPPWTLVGGGALAGFHLGHRDTRDLDLFWRGQRELGEVVTQVERVLAAAGKSVHVLQRTPGFARMRVLGDSETVILDLVADVAPAMAGDELRELGEARIRVASAHDILVSKLCALLGRAEVRDLVDVEALLNAGGDLPLAVDQAPQIDGGFSAVTLAWVLNGFDPRRLAAATGIAADTIEHVIRFRDDLVERLLRMTRPE